MNNKPKTIICDIDGVLLEHRNQGLSSQLNASPLKGTIEKQLLMYDIFYDKLIMGVGGGDRVVINDRKPNSERDTAYSINLYRNEGVEDVKL